FYTPEDQADGRPQRNLETAAAEGAAKDEGWRVRKDGSRFWATVVITALRDKTGELRGFGKVTRDITDKHNEEERLREYANQMAELEQAKAQFLDLAAHELRGPLTLIRGYNSLLRAGSLPADKIPEVAQMLEGKLEQVDLLVQQMLEMGRLENNKLELQYERVDMYEVAAEQIKRVQPIAAGREIALHNGRGRAIVHADRSRAGTIVANLLDNALKYSPKGGPVECEVGRDGSDAYVLVRDKGFGIAEEHMPLLFKRYSRLPTEENKQIRGTGLALYLCQEIARRHGGEITVSSRLGDGSAFKLVLPLAG
ncbi:MAG TPA: PAS domain-containing sensor histidine kinase, partial [Candidatus Dormibacteraeota bacterium]|nr:PAS domain-containing sensor histidine kinase [Candidatus Dormibacteraeota bacterium]